MLLPEYDSELKEFNLNLGKKIEKEGGQAFFISIARMLPKRLSRIEELKMAV